ncbi:MAG: asparagine synthase (glutamine-hydrolyzing) [Spirochaetes bacterium]|nr:asparagine synthase (glutamine-hydrolyzing) [Spirochaetota bacterium]
MCGICGIINFEDSSYPDIEKLKKMMQYLYHRGPDSGGYYRDKTVAFGHTRLSIIDFETGDQPICNENKTLWIVYNGEIFNYVELREELQSFGHIFQTKSDTEVIVHAYEQWGIECLNRFNGQWAFALWDINKREVILSRDNYGICPLYYTKLNNIFYFASEIKSIFVNREIRREFDPEGIKELLTFWNPVAPRTIFSDINLIPPGHYIKITKNGFKSEPYWDLSSHVNCKKTKIQTTQDKIEILKEKLIKAVRLRFSRSDVPVGAYLSGGLDSSIISAIINQFTSAPLKTFSVSFEDKDFDETIYQKQIADKLGTEHHTIKVDYKSIGEIFPKVIWHTEQPVLRTAPAPLFLLSNLVNDLGYKVVVTGEGSDEIFAGYDIFKEAKVRQFIAKDPDSKIRIRLLEKLYPWMKRNPNAVLSFSSGFFKKNLHIDDFFFSHRLRWNTTSSIQYLLNRDMIQTINTYDPVDKLLSMLPDQTGQWDLTAKTEWIEIVTLLSSYLLSAQGDRMLMAHGVEGRFPFLDADVTGYANSFLPEDKLNGLTEKFLLKKAFRNMIPEEITKRPKQPYRAPDAASFFYGKAVSWMKDILNEKVIKEAGVFNPKTVYKFILKCGSCSGLNMSHTDNMRIVAILSIMLIYHLFISYNGFEEKLENIKYIKKIDLLKK